MPVEIEKASMELYDAYARLKSDPTSYPMAGFLDSLIKDAELSRPFLRAKIQFPYAEISGPTLHKRGLGKRENFGKVFGID